MKFGKSVSASLFLMLALVATSANAAPITIDGITFPDGALSFADAVVSYTPGTGVSAPWNNPAESLGLPDYTGSDGMVSLGTGGTLIVRFTDNSLTTSGNSTPDLHIFEVGAVTEFFNLSISTDGISWIDLGDVLGQPTSVDIDGRPGVVAGTQYSYVRLIDVLPNQSGTPFAEADIDAIGAISSAPPVPSTVPEPASMMLLATGLALVGRKVYRQRTR